MEVHSSSLDLVLHEGFPPKQCGVLICTAPARLNQFKCKQVKDRRGFGFKASGYSFSTNTVEKIGAHANRSVCCQHASRCLAWFVPTTLSDCSNQALRTGSMNATAISHWLTLWLRWGIRRGRANRKRKRGAASTWKKSRFARNLGAVLRCPDCAAGNTSGLMAKTSNIHAAAGVRPNPC